MNKTEVLNLLAGHEIDMLIADKIVHWNHNHQINECEDGWYDYCEICGFEPRFSEEVIPGNCGGYPKYSSDVSRVWEILEKFTYYEIKKLGHTYNVYIENDDNIRTGIDQGDDLPLVVCHAALLATMEINNE